MSRGDFILTIALDPLVHDALERERVAVRVAKSPYDLVVLAATLRPMLVIVDRTIDEAAALAVLEALDSPYLARVPVAIFSADDEPDDDEEEGVFLLRPRDVKGLLRIVRRTKCAGLVLH